MQDSLRFLTESDRALLHERAERRRYGPDETILAEGSRQQAIFVVRQGAVRIERDHLGRGVPFARLDEGEVFGEMSFIEEADASASVVAHGDVEVEVIELPHVQNMLESVPGFAARFYRSLALTLAERLRRTSQLACPPMSWG